MLNADVLYACDHTWWVQYIKEVRACFKGELWTLSSTAKCRHGLNWVPSARGEGYSCDKIHTGGNSGYQALGLAALWGASRIVLLGYDMQKSGGKSHWHGDHPKGLGNGGNLARWAGAMGGLARDLAHSGIEVINCSRMTALKCFPRQSLAQALA